MSLANIRGRQFAGAFLGVLAFGLAVAYGRSFHVGFYFDDSYGIRDNSAIRSLASVPSFFTDPYTLTTVHENVDLRPILVTTYALNYAVSGNDPWSYHALNLVIHFLTSWMVFLLVRDHLWWPVSSRGADGSARFAAAGAALLFALAPVNNQALNYMWARSALLCSAFYIGAFLSILNRHVFFAVMLLVLALMTKAIALTLPAVFVAYNFLYRNRERQPDLRSWLHDWKDLVPAVLPLAIVNVAYLVVRHFMLPDWADDTMHEKWVTPWIWMMSQWSALLHYVRIFVWPTGMSIDNDFPYATNFAQLRAWGSLTVILVWLAAAMKWSKSFPHVAFATVWFFVTLAPESTIAPLAEVVNDHRPYIASTLGLSVLLTWVLDRASTYAGRRRHEMFVALVLVISTVFAVLGYRRTEDWASSGDLWEATTRTSPNNGRAWMNAGLELYRKGNLKEARRRYEKSRELAPAYPYLYINLSVLENAEGHRKEALAYAQQAVRLGPSLAPSHYFLGFALEQDGNTKDALIEYRRALEIDPRHVPSFEGVARLESATAKNSWSEDEKDMIDGLRLLDKDGDPLRAVEKFRALLARNPDHYGATFQLARALDAAGRRDEARTLWEKMRKMAEDVDDAATKKLVLERLEAPKH